MADLKNTYITLKLGNGGGGSIDPSVLEGYATSGDMQSAFTLISETQQVAAAGLNQLEGRIDELSGSSVDLSAYWTSAQTENAISAATSGKADAVNITANTNKFYFPKWNNQGVVNGYVISEMKLKSLFLNGDNKVILGQSSSSIKIWAPEVSGNPGEIVVSTGSGAPVWSAVTFPDVSNYVTSAQVETQIVAKNYITSAATANMVTSTYVSTIWKGTQAQYDAITTKDPNTFYIIVNN